MKTTKKILRFGRHQLWWCLNVFPTRSLPGSGGRRPCHGPHILHQREIRAAIKVNTCTEFVKIKVQYICFVCYGVWGVASTKQVESKELTVQETLIHFFCYEKYYDSKYQWQCRLSGGRAYTKPRTIQRRVGGRNINDGTAAIRLPKNSEKIAI